MQYLKAALLSVYEGDGALQSVVKNMYFVNRPASGQRPFVLIRPIVGSHIYTSHNRIDWLPINFVVEARTEASLMAAVDLIYLAYDTASLIYTGSYTHVSIRRVDFDGPHEDSGTWTFTIYYVIQRVKVRA